MKTKKTAIIYAVLAAALYALNAPISKLLLAQIPSTMMAGLLYLGAGIGMFFMGLPLFLLPFQVFYYPLKI